MPDAGCQSPSTEVDVRLRPDLSVALTALAEVVEQFAADESLSGPVPFNLNLVLDEMITNSISHGLQEVAEPELRLRLYRNGDTLVAQVEDNGMAFNPFKDAPSPDTEQALNDRPIGGLGVFLVRQFTDEAFYERDGDVNRITIRLNLETQ